MAGRIAFRLLAVALLLAGCAAPAVWLPISPSPEGNLWPVAFGTPITLSGNAAEPDITVAPSGLVLVCALAPGGDKDGSDAALVWSSRDNATFTRMPRAGEVRGDLDCAVSSDAQGNAYFVDAGGALLTLATTTDGKAWATASALDAGPGFFDRPWLLGGASGQALLVAQQTERGGNVAYETTDAGKTWDGPALANPLGVPTYQTDGNLARGPGGVMAFPFGVQGPDGAAVDPREVWVASSSDGHSWSYALVAKDRGNTAYVFPSMAADNASFYVAWAELRPDAKGVQVYVAASPDAKTWSAPRPVNAPDTTALMPRVEATSAGPLVLYHVANGTLDPPTQVGKYRFVAMWPDGASWREEVLSNDSHEGIFSMGGYGTLPAELLKRGQDSPNRGSLLHTFGLTIAPDGRVWVAWAEDPKGAPPIVRIAHT